MPTWVKRWQVRSHTKRDEVYVVALRKDGTFGCSCKFWVFHHKPKVDCLHIGDVRQKTGYVVGYESQPVLTPQPQVVGEVSRFDIVEF